MISVLSVLGTLFCSSCLQGGLHLKRSCAWLGPSSLQNTSVFKSYSRGFAAPIIIEHTIVIRTHHQGRTGRSEIYKLVSGLLCAAFPSSCVLILYTSAPVSSKTIDLDPTAVIVPVGLPSSTCFINSNTPLHRLPLTMMPTIGQQAMFTTKSIRWSKLIFMEKKPSLKLSTSYPSPKSALEWNFQATLNSLSCPELKHPCWALCRVLPSNVSPPFSIAFWFNSSLPCDAREFGCSPT